MSWCGFCHEASVMYCPNNECREENTRACVCKECADGCNMKCIHCGERFVEEDELWGD